MPNGEGSHRWPEGDLSNSRWQGATEQRVLALEDWVRDLDAKYERDRKSAQEDVTALRIQVAQLYTKVGVWSAAGGVIGAGIVSGVVAWLGH